MTDAIQQFETIRKSCDFLFVVYYRGQWCPFCMSYLTTLATLSGSISAAGGRHVIVTAENAVMLPKVREATGYGGAAIIDPTHSLAKELKSRGLLDVAITEKKGYSHGVAQPAVLVLSKDGKVLYRWNVVPSLMNMGGAKDRPELPQIWANVQATLRGDQPVYTKISRTTASQLLGRTLRKAIWVS